MFQFPGFAFLTLCIQVKNTWFTQLVNAEAFNRWVSSGLPHSEIHGSKHILSSPWLIAEYHVLHRLLLPRHSPNALNALDLIQKKLDFFFIKSRHLRFLKCLLAQTLLDWLWLLKVNLIELMSLLTQWRTFPDANRSWQIDDWLRSSHHTQQVKRDWLVYLTWKDCKSWRYRVPTHALEGVTASRA